MKKAQVTHLFLQIGTHVSGETTDLWTVEIFIKFEYILLELFYIFTQTQTIRCYCIVSCFSPDFHEVHPLSAKVTLRVTPHFMSGRAAVSLCVFQGSYSLRSHVEFLYTLSGLFF